MKHIKFLLIGVIAMLAWSCSSDISDDTFPGSIDGSVADKTTGEPVATVSVTLSPGGNSTVTGSDGSFSFTNLEAQEYEVTIHKEGYNEATTTVFVRNGQSTPAHLLIERIPDIVTADRVTLDFGDNQSLNTLSFNIVNSGYEDLEWEIEERCEWITEVKPAKGVLAYGKTEGIVVVIDRSKLKAGENKAVIVIRSTHGSTEMNVVAIGEERYLPTLNTLEVTNLTSSSVTLNAEIVKAGEPPYIERGFVYSLNQLPTIENSIAKLTCKVDNNKKFSFALEGLNYDKTYYVRAYAINELGTAYSTNSVKFTTPFSLPKVKTIEVINVDFSGGTATFRGEITDMGDPAYTERGFVYATFSQPTVNDSKIVANGVGVKGSFSVSASNLPKGTYYVRAYATNSFGTAYGEEIAIEPEWIEFPEMGIAVQTSDLSTSVYYEFASSICKDSRVGGFSDWRVPTMTELMFIRTNMSKIPNLSTSSRYWSSSISSAGNHQNLDLYSGMVHTYITANVRAVRTLK